VVLAVKALGNIGNAVSETISELNKCIEEASGNGELRLAAIDALRRQPCVPERRSIIEKIFYNDTVCNIENAHGDRIQCPEARIAAFRQLMQCPDEAIVSDVIDNLNNETSNQGEPVMFYV
jgi:hypothetical protein